MTEVSAVKPGIIDALRQRYARPEFQLEFEVTLNNRRLDAVALGLWSSSGYMLTGFEIKTSRSDFQREITNHLKAEQWFSVVDAFYFVAPTGLIPLSDLPAGCGLLEFKNGKLRLKAHPVTNPSKDRPMPREVAARFINRIGERDEAARRLERAELRAVIRKELLQEQASKGDPHARQLADMTRLYEEQRDRVLLMESAMGLTPRDWIGQQETLRACRIAARITTVDVMREEVKRSRGLLQRALAQYDEVIADLQTVQAP